MCDVLCVVCRVLSVCAHLPPYAQILLGPQIDSAVQFDGRELEIEVCAAKGLQKADAFGLSDPYVKVRWNNKMLGKFCFCYMPKGVRLITLYTPHAPPPHTHQEKPRPSITPSTLSGMRPSLPSYREACLFQIALYTWRSGTPTLSGGGLF
jgi:C2 domain